MRPAALSPLVALLAFGCSRPQEPTPGPSGPSGPVVVTVGKPQKLALKRTVEQPGTVEAYEQTDVFAMVIGYIQSVNKDIGDEVRPGELLAELSVPELVQEHRQKQAMTRQTAAEVRQAEAAVQAAEAAMRSAAAQAEEAKAGRKRAQANYERWQTELNRVTSLVERNVIDQQTRDETRNQFRAAEAAREEVEARVRSLEAAENEAGARRDKAQADLAVARAREEVAAADEKRLAALVGYTRLTAPAYRGIVTQRSAFPGTLARPGGAGREAPLFVVARIDPVRVFLDVPESAAAQVTKDVPASVRVPAQGGRSFPGAVSRTSWSLDPRTRTLRTAIDLKNPRGELRPGMYVTASLTVEQPPAWTLPAGAVVKYGEATYCFLVKDGKASRLAVRTGYSDGKRVEVLEKQSGDEWSPFAGDEEVIQGGAATLAEGQPVTVKGSGP
jgi:RND family efflux transporter MFP subunit